MDLAIPNVVAELGQSRRRIAAVEAANRLHRPTGFKVQRALAANRGSGRARTWQRLVVQPLRLSPGVRSFAVSARPLEGELGGSVAGRLGHGRARHRPTGGILIPAARSAGVAFEAASNPLPNCRDRPQDQRWRPIERQAMPTTAASPATVRLETPRTQPEPPGRSPSQAPISSSTSLSGSAWPARASRCGDPPRPNPEQRLRPHGPRVPDRSLRVQRTPPQPGLALTATSRRVAQA